MSSGPSRNSDVFFRKKNRMLRGVRKVATSTHRSSGPGGPRGQSGRATEILREQREHVIRGTIANRSVETHFQPIVDLRSGRPVGAEALSRFRQLPSRAPDAWFAEAAAVGLGVELELIALEVALGQLHLLPTAVYVSLNASVETIMTEEFHAMLSDATAERIVLELTEHTQVSDYLLLERSIGDLRSQGVRLAVDDAGAGYSSLLHILSLKPDVIKLDISLTRGIDKDPARRSLGRALMAFGLDAYNASVVAEGIETKGEFDTLRALGCPQGQGFYLGRPGRLAGSRSHRFPTSSDIPAFRRLRPA